MASSGPEESPPPTTLEDLPSDLIAQIITHAGARAALKLSHASRGLNEIATSDEAWQSLFDSRFVDVVTVFGGRRPEPPRGISWMRHYLEFDLSWLSLAHELAGKVLIRVEGRLFDVTGFVDEHPGDPQLLLAAAGRDASDAFAYVGHSDHAFKLLRSMEVKRLRGLRPEFALAAERGAEAAAAGSGAAGADAEWGDGFWGGVAIAAGYLRQARDALEARGTFRSSAATELLRAAFGLEPAEAQRGGLYDWGADEGAGQD